MHRTPKGKRLVITSRDMGLFRALSYYRYLRSTYLHAFVGGASETLTGWTAEARLGL